MDVESDNIRRTELALKLISEEFNPANAHQKDFETVTKAACQFLVDQFQPPITATPEAHPEDLAIGDVVDAEVANMVIRAEAYKELEGIFKEYGDKNVLTFASKMRDVLAKVRVASLQQEKVENE